ncbi:hypothetical protein B0T20DRAFT_352557 [Sordaria brevicollis]|uniref:Uncharacterized protein n=1 Tax=Sordaria brevicollis TaxID=83679 RepID=A0AAE0PEU3_SORBR|nr:hypothetical protein B0T20DRAFT_352557 [Sordaria brevicollis]
MPTYLCHGFRWQRRSIRVYTVVQDLDDVSPEWLIKPTSSRCLLQSFYNLFEFLPYCNPPPLGYESGRSWNSEESEDNSEEGSDVEKVEEPKSAGAQEKNNERSQWPERLESLGVIRGLKEKEKEKEKHNGTGKSAAEGKVVEDASSAITAIHVGGGSESTSRTASRSPSLKLPLQGSRTSSKTGKAGSSATTPTATTPTATFPTAPTSRSTSTLGVSSSSGHRKSKKTSRSRHSSHSPNRKRDELSAQSWSAVKVLEEYDPNNLDEVSRPYAYVADHVIRIDGAVDIMAEVKLYEERMQRQKGQEEVVPKKAEKATDENRGGRGRGDEEFHDALEHLTEEEQIAKQEKEQTWIKQLRDELQRGEEIKWYVVVNGDEERNYSNGFDDEEDEEDEFEYDEEELLSESNFNYGTSYESTEDHLTTSNFPPAARSPTTEGGGSRSSPYLSQHSAGARSRTSSRGGARRSRSKSKSRSQSRSHSRTQDRHRSHSRQRLQHGKKIRRPKPTKEQRQHHAQYTLQQELFERNDLRASASSSTPTPTQQTPIPTPAPATGPTSPTVPSTATRMITGSTTATGRQPPTAMRNMNTKAVIKEGAARRVMSEGGVHRQSSRGIPVVPRSPEIPIIMVTPTRMTFSVETPEDRTGTAGGRRVYQQPQQQQTEYPTRQQQEHQQHQQQYQQQPKQQQQPQQQQHQQLPQQQPQPQTFYQPESRKPSIVGNVSSSMGIITTAPAAAVSSFSLDTTPSNTVPGHPSNPTSDPSPKKSHHPPLSFSFGTTFGNGHRDGGHNSGTTSKRSSLSSLRTPSSWSCLNLSLGHSHHKDGHKDKDGGHKDGHNDDSDSDTNQPPRPSPSPPIAVQVLHPSSSSYEPVSTLPPRPAPPPPATAATRPGRPLTPPPPPSAIGLALSDSSYHHRVPTAPSSPVAIKISATPAPEMSVMRPDTHGQGQGQEEDEEGAAAPPVVGQYSSKTMPTKRRGNHARFGSRSRSSGSLRRLFQRTSGKEGWI